MRKKYLAAQRQGVIFLKIDKEKLNALAKLDDDALWVEVKTIAARHGFKLPDATPKHEQMEKLRTAVTDTEKINLSGAIKIINQYRKEQK